MTLWLAQPVEAGAITKPLRASDHRYACTDTVRKQKQTQGGGGIIPPNLSAYH